MSDAVKPTQGDKPTTPQEYLDRLPPDRRKTIAAIRKTINARRDKRTKEGIQYGMIGWMVPHSVFPAGYHCDPAQPLPFVSVASQKNHIGIYLFCLYTDEEAMARFVEEWKATGKKLDMGKSCIRVKSLEDLPMDVLGDAIARMDCDTFIAQYESRWGASRRKPAAKQPSKKAAEKKSASTRATKPTAKKTAKKSAAAKKIGKKPGPARDGR